MSHKGLIASYFTIAGDINPLTGDTTSPFDIRARAEAAGRAGFCGLGLFHTDLEKSLAKYDIATLRAMFDDNGLGDIELEFIFDWYSEGESRKAGDAVRRSLLEAAEALGAWHIKIGGDLNHRWPTDHLIEEFAQLCDDARSVGTKISLEMAPVTTIDSLRLAREIVEGADRPNGGYMIDIWHINRADNETTRGHGAWRCGRRFCGEGDFDIAGLVKAVEATGFSGPYGVEILSDELRRLSLEDAVQKVFTTTMAYL